MLRALALALVLTLSPLAHADKAAPADAAMERFRDAWTKDDATGLVAQLADDVVLVGGGAEVTRGKEAVAAWARKQLAATGAMTVTAVTSGDCDDVAWQVGRWTLGTFSGTHTFLFKKDKRGWKIFSMHIDNDPPAAKKS